MNPLCTHSATRLARMIREQEVTARQVVDAHIARIAEVNPRINAVVAERFAAARGEADAADERIRSGGEPPPLLGVPCTIKECIATTGMPQASGLVRRRDVRAEADAPAVASLRAAGAIVLGVTNTSELCMWMETNNRLYGRTNNPYDRRRIVGGSSGGEGAIVGAGGVPLGLGADIGGSIRMPAFFCGVFGHKATGGLLDNRGHYPLPDNEALRYLTLGPLCRRAEDLLPALRILAGSPGARPFPLGDPAAVRIADLCVYTIEDDGRNPVHPELRAAQGRCAEALRAEGARVEVARLPALRHSLAIWSSLLSASGGPSFRELLFEEAAGLPLLWELPRLLLRRSPHTLPALGLVLLERLPGLLPRRARRFVAAGRELREELVALLSARGPGVLLYPSYPTPAPRHVLPLFLPFHWVYTAILNVLEVPATQVPLGLSRGGLPLGIQVAAVHEADHLSIATAMFLEQRFGGWVPPP